MIREIKFRAWDKSKKSMVNSFNIFDLRSNYPSDPYEEIIIESSNKGDIEFKKDNLILLQYTGLKDKSGKEIYEGDVILVADSYTDVITDDGQGPTEDFNHLAPIIYNEKFGCFGVNIEHGGDYFDKGFSSFEKIQSNLGILELEVIGNIYESPELQEPKNDTK